VSHSHCRKATGQAGRREHHVAGGRRDCAGRPAGKCSSPMAPSAHEAGVGALELHQAGVSRLTWRALKAHVCHAVHAGHAEVIVRAHSDAGGGP
jgi:hypothetical protein